MASIRTNPYHLYLVSLKFPGSSWEKASWTDGKPANVLVSLLTAGAAGSLAAGSFGAAGDGRVNAGGLDDMPVSDGVWIGTSGVVGMVSGAATGRVAGARTGARPGNAMG